MDGPKVSDNINNDFLIIEYIVDNVKNTDKFICKNKNDPDYFCSLCNHTIEHSASDKKFRLSLWTHINEVTHLDNVTNSNESEEQADEKRKQIQKNPKLNCAQLKNAFDSFQLNKQERTMSSKHFITKISEGKAFHCCLCDVEIHSSNNDEFRFNLLLHLNDKTHKFKHTTVYKHLNGKVNTKRKRVCGQKVSDKGCVENLDQETELLQEEVEKCEKNEENKKEQNKESQSLVKKASETGIVNYCSGELLNKKDASKNCFELLRSKSVVETEILKEWDKMTIDRLEEVQSSKFKGRVKKQLAKEIKKSAKRRNNNVDHSDELKDFFDSLEQSNPVTVISKYFIKKASNEKDFSCTLCDAEILYPLNTNEFRYNLWCHINDKNHREKLPNYEDIVKSFEKEKEKISKSLPNAYKKDADFFDIGDQFRYAKCNLCNVAVSLNFYRLTNHIKGEEHTQNRGLIMRGREPSKKDPQICSKREYALLKSKIDGKFSKDMKFIQPGKVPGYVVCIVCCHAVLPTKYYLEKHFEKECHVKNRPLRPVNKSNMNLDALMEKIPSDLKGYKSIFVEDDCGVKCIRCQELIPATSHDLFSHINKERKI